MSTAEATVAPDLAFAVEVWRAWRVVRRDDRYVLASVLKPTVWPRGEPLVAECLHVRPWSRHFWRRSDCHDAPELRCECGIYGADLTRLGRYLTPAPFELITARVIGRVSLWGTVIACEFGYRASRAYPSCIYVPIDAVRDARELESVATSLADYGVAVELLPERSEGAPLAIARMLQAA